MQVIDNVRAYTREITIPVGSTGIKRRLKPMQLSFT